MSNKQNAQELTISGCLVSLLASPFVFTFMIVYMGGALILWLVHYFFPHLFQLRMGAKWRRHTPTNLILWVRRLVFIGGATLLWISGRPIWGGGLLLVIALLLLANVTVWRQRQQKKPQQGKAIEQDGEAGQVKPPQTQVETSEVALPKRSVEPVQRPTPIVQSTRKPILEPAPAEGVIALDEAVAAIEQGQLELVAQHLQEGLDPNSRTSEGQSLLSIAYKHDHLPLVELLLQNGANPNVRSTFFDDAKHHLRFEPHLLKLSLTPYQQGPTLLTSAIIKPDPDLFALLMNYPVNPNLIGDVISIQVESMQTVHFFYGGPLHLAAAHGQEAMLNSLLQAGADPNLENRYGTLALHHATFQGHRDCTKLLIAAGSVQNTTGVIIGMNYSAAGAHSYPIKGTPYELAKHAKLGNLAELGLTP